ncbi:MAG: C39 family peptidase [Succiniclasticum sp.]|jgi:hypothetical protein|nr:C39 family peptidase [Succiniclasticum sp.]MEE3479200.1 C39 family peptidase [Succiniclasticum sp.]
MTHKLKYVVLPVALAMIVTGLNILQHADAEEAGPLTSLTNSIIAVLQQDGGGANAVLHQADVKDSPYFKHVDVYHLKNGGSLTILEQYKTTQQHTEYTCGPAAAWTVMTHFLGTAPDDELAIAKVMNTHTASMKDPGTNTRNMSRYFEQKGWTVHNALKDGSPKDFEAFRAFVLKNLKAGTPIMVENIDWGGHWRVIIGYDTMGDDKDANDVLILADPYDTTDHLQDGYNLVSAERFYYSWFDAHLFKKGEQQRQWVTAVPPRQE